MRVKYLYWITFMVTVTYLLYVYRTNDLFQLKLNQGRDITRKIISHYANTSYSRSRKHQFTVKGDSTMTATDLFIESCTVVKIGNYTCRFGKEEKVLPFATCLILNKQVDQICIINNINRKSITVSVFDLQGVRHSSEVSVTIQTREVE